MECRELAKVLPTPEHIYDEYIAALFELKDKLEDLYTQAEADEVTTLKPSLYEYVKASCGDLPEHTHMSAPQLFRVAMNRCNADVYTAGRGMTLDDAVKWASTELHAIKQLIASITKTNSNAA